VSHGRCLLALLGKEAPDVTEHPSRLASSARRRLRILAAATAFAALGATAGSAHAVTGPFTWKGYTWTPTTGGMAGVCQGDPANISIDASGYLHLKIVKNGSTWSASEIFTNETLGVGTYQWQIGGPIDRMDHTVVLGLFPYGPQAGIGQDGTNEIDSEFSYWNDEAGNINADWTVYAPTTSVMPWEDDFLFSLNGGSATTSRIDWTSTGIVGTIMSGFQPIGATQSVLASKSYMPGGNVSSEIPQQALPLGMNLWCYKAPPASGQDVEIVIQDFQFVPDGQPIPDAGAQGGPDADEGDSASGADATEEPSATSSGSDGAMASSGSSSGGSSSGSGSGGSGSGSGSSSGGGDDASTGPGTSSSGGSSNTFGDTPGTSSGCACVTAGPQSLGLGPLFAAVGLALLGTRRRAGKR
jgi:uncharacterized membrane protein YgcG